MKKEKEKENFSDSFFFFFFIPCIEFLNNLEKQTKVPKFYLLVGVVAVVVVLVILNIGASLLT